ncbi:terminase large subunit [Granulicella cerasi]|uniref:Terminase large subunit n=1 Tax=Granulicella cerasi TaxID=741063 RepID=A0ABW1Z3K9_9BACT|nr:terminase TerL endonuclease subunit [Granulicella cerasi]
MTNGATSSTNDYAARATQYARDVVDGKVLYSKWIRLAAQRHLNDLIRPDFRWTFCSDAANKVCQFAELCRHEKGSKQGQRIKLEAAQIFILASIFGWIDSTSLRKYREAIIMLPRGNGKSPLAAIIGLYMAFFSGEKGAEVYCGANSEKQASEVFRPAKAMVEQESRLASIGIQCAAKSIFQLSTRSRFQPVVRKPGDGASVWCGILDELHEAQDATLYDTFKTGANKRPGSLILVISTAGVSSTENPCLALQRKAEQMLDGVIEDDRLFAALHGADPDVDWTSPLAVEMANPLLGVSNDREAILLDQQEAVRNSAKQNIFKAKHLNIWSTASSAWMNIAAWNKCYDAILTEESVKQLPCWIGSDLASKLDLSAVVRVYRDDSQGDRPHYYAITRSYLPEERVNLPENQHYLGWSKQDYLSATPGSSIDYATLEADVLADIASNQVKELAYDARYADHWAQRVSELSGIPRVEVPPSPSVLSPAMKELEAAVADGRFHHDGNPVLTWCISNVLTRETSVGNYTMPDKARPESKIDCAVALFIAMARARLGTQDNAEWSFTPFWL